MTTLNHTVGPKRPTWTHIAFAVKDVDATIAWYETFTHLTLLARSEDADGKNAWIGDASNAESPFVLVVGQFYEGHDPFAPAPHHPMGPFAHIGIEVESKAAVDEIADGVLWLSSSAAAFVTGTALSIDGGYSAA